MKSYEPPEDKDSRVSGVMQKLQDAPKGKLQHIHIEPAQNGFSVRVHRDLPPAPAEQEGKGDGSDRATGAASQADGTTHSVFQKKKDVLSHIESHLNE